MPRRQFPISWYLVAFIVAAIIPVAFIAYMSLSKAEQIEAQAALHNRLNAYAEFKAVLSDIETKAIAVARNLSAWDETILHFSDPTYYEYWRESRVHDAGILNYTIDSVELYDRDGKPLAANNRISDRVIEQAIETPVLMGTADVPYLVYFHPVFLKGQHGPDIVPDGYLAVSVDIGKAVESHGMVHRSNPSTANWRLQEGERIGFSEAINRVELNIYNSPQMESFSMLVRRSLWESVLFSIILLIVFSFLLVSTLGKPLQNLARHIKKMHDGLASEIPETIQSLARIEELEQVRLAVNKYRNKFHTARDSLMEKNRELERLTFRDTLTGVYNRRAFETHLLQALESARNEGMEHALCYLDLDQFKVVNDTCGHVAGDELLKQVTARLQARLREADILARLGGDEFGVLLIGCSMSRASRIGEDLRRTVKDFRFVWEDKVFDIGVSIGLVAISQDAASLADLLKMADAACYMAKDLGRNRVQIYQPDDKDLAQRYGEMQWVSKITRALEENRFELYCQAIEPLTGEANDGVYYELLIRMLDDKGELVPPMAFLPAAERYNLISSIDRWVIGASCDLLKMHRRLVESRNIIVSINLSGQSLGDTDILEYAVGQLNQAGISPEHFCFEVTETAAITHLVSAKRFIGILRSMGCRFALDDFGSGLSSFAYLKNLQVDCLKIDGHFVKNMVNDPIDRAMVVSINEIGHLMGMKTIAEFVEDEGIAGALKEIGVDYAQGYHIAKPVPFARLLEQYREDEEETMLDAGSSH